MDASTNRDVLAGLIFATWQERLDAFLLEDVIREDLDLIVKLVQGRAFEILSAGASAESMCSHLKSAAVYALEQTLFREGASHYQTLGVATDATEDAIRGHYRLLMQIVHPDRRTDDMALSDDFAPRVNRAYAVLRDPTARAVYDRESRDASGALWRQGIAATSTVRSQFPISQRRVFRPSKLPEWLTHGVGGFVLNNPTTSIFGAMAVASLVFLAATIALEHEPTLTRDEPANVSRLVIGGKNLGVVVTPAETRPRAAIPAPVAPLSVEAASPAMLPAGAVTRTAQVVPKTVPTFRPLVTVADPRPTTRSTEVEQPSGPTAVAVAPGQPTAARSAIVNALGPPERRFPEMKAMPDIGNADRAPVTAPTFPNGPQVAGLISSLPSFRAFDTLPTQGNGRLSSAAPTENARADALRSPTSADVESLIAAFISYYENGRLDSFSSLFAADARTNHYSGRAAISADYNELFQRSNWRKMSVRQLLWRNVGDRTEAVGEVTYNIGWRDGREVEHRVAVEMDLIRRGDRVLIARLSQKVRE